ncbi:MAG: hypothetical protein A2X12_04075 [Bacteroidetes bacterium GWE2_29_8]|nr:MAG: hypothetical protein A2X12_04075 [Bacteroidetes bacterium GWE2_29_8]OFY24954.1 MAG: hypothetical protein A2X02_07925 [Bacteroidetes bacterium GWF2_29_10]
MISAIKKIYKNLLVLKKLKHINSWYWAKMIHERDIPIDKFEYNKANDSIIIKEFNYELKKDDNLAILYAYNIALNLNKRLGFKFYKENKEAVFDYNGTKAVIKTLSDFYIVQEIFFHNVYRFYTNNSIVLWNIGTNIALADLYFATQNDIIKIYGYEPFKNNYEEALHNISLNPPLKDKIEIFQSGISNKDESVELEYSPEYKGNSGKIGLKEGMKSLANIETIQLKDASSVFNDILSKHHDAEIIVKIDCEGAEYDIIERLAESNLLQHVNAFLIEWHQKGTEQLIQYLNKNGFISFTYGEDNHYVGMIYSVRTGK